MPAELDGTERAEEYVAQQLRRWAEARTVLAALRSMEIRNQDAEKKLAAQAAHYFRLYEGARVELHDTVRDIITEGRRT